MYRMLLLHISFSLKMYEYNLTVRTSLTFSFSLSLHACLEFEVLRDEL